MSRKFACLFLAAATLLSVLTVVHANEKQAQEEAYAAAAAVLSEAGVVSQSATALTDGRGMALAAELGMLSRSSALSLSQLAAHALQTRQAQSQSLQEAEKLAEERLAYRMLYDGFLLQQDTVLRTAADHSADAVRSIAQGKVARLLDNSTEDWYRVSFGGEEGYVPADAGSGVRYADYEGSTATRDLVAELVDYAYTYLGTPYAYGGTGYGGIDCSGFTMRCFDYVGYFLSHGARDQYRRGTPVTTEQRDVGDLVFFSGPGSDLIEHVGIYLGSGRFIHASTTEGVTVDSVYASYYADYYYGAVRIIHE